MPAAPVVGCLLACLALASLPAGGTADARAPESEAPSDSWLSPRKVAPPEIRGPSRRAGAWIAKVLLPTAVRRRPGGKGRVWLARPQTKFNRQAQRLLILAKRRTSDGREWLQVRLPVRPNDSAGWIPLDRVLLSRTQYWITIKTGRRQVRVVHAGRLLRKVRAVVGNPATPTPPGLFAVYETVKQPDPSGFLGSWALHLTAHSSVLENFGGGDGRVAIHGRGGASFADPLGSAASHGCIRVDNHFIAWLQRRAPAGTPVRIMR